MKDAIMRLLEIYTFGLCFSCLIVYMKSDDYELGQKITAGALFVPVMVLMCLLILQK